MDDVRPQRKFYYGLSAGLILGLLLSFALKWVSGILMGVLIGIASTHHLRDGDRLLTNILIAVPTIWLLILIPITSLAAISSNGRVFSRFSLREIMAPGLMLCLVCAITICGFLVGFAFPLKFCGDHKQVIERNFGKVQPGMSSGEALKTIFDGAYIHPESADPRSNSADEIWPIWGYDLVDALRARSAGSYPFTLRIDKKTGTVVWAERVHNTRFD